MADINGIYKVAWQRRLVISDCILLPKLIYSDLLFSGHCKVDQTEKGWFIQYIDRDPRVLQRQKELEKQKAREKDDDARQARYAVYQ